MLNKYLKKDKTSKKMNSFTGKVKRCKDGRKESRWEFKKEAIVGEEIYSLAGYMKSKEGTAIGKAKERIP